MRRNSLILIPILILAAGCRQGETTVYVDLGQILSESKPPQPPAIPQPVPPAVHSDVVKVIPGATARELQDPSNTPQLNVAEMFRAEQAKALVALQHRLRQFYNSEIDRFRLQQEQGLSGEERKAYDAALDKIRIEFDKWAGARSQKYARLALIAGFPDPNPTSKTPEKPLRPLAQVRFNDAKKLRTQLKAIDDDFYKQASAILASVLDQTSASRAQLQLNLAKFATGLDKKAEEEARSQIREAVSNLNLKLAASSPVTFPAVPPRTIEIGKEPPIQAPPQVPSGGIPSGEADRMRMLQNEERIWASVNRYRLGDHSQGARDATHEFQLWRQQHGLGP